MNLRSNTKLSTAVNQETLTATQIYQHNSVVFDLSKNAIKVKNEFCEFLHSLDFRMELLLGHQHQPSVGTNNAPIRDSYDREPTPDFQPTMFVNGPQSVIFYTNGIFVVQDLISRKFVHYYEENTPQSIDPYDENRNIGVCTQRAQVRTNRKTDTLLMQYFQAGESSLFAVLKLAGNSTYLSVFWPHLSQQTDLQTDDWLKSTGSSLIQRRQTEHAAYLIRVSPSQIHCYHAMAYHSNKRYLYLLYSETSTRKQYLKILELQKNSRKHKVLLVWHLNKCGSGEVAGQSSQLAISKITVGRDHREIYLSGWQYFRHWAISFHEKTMKQSNYRNIERAIKKDSTIGTFWLSDRNGPFLSTQISSLSTKKHSQRSIMNNEQMDILAIVTSQQVIFVSNNQIVKKSGIKTENHFKILKKQAVEVSLEKSLDRIYRSEFENPKLGDADDCCVSSKEVDADKENSLCAISSIAIRTPSQTLKSRKNCSRGHRTIAQFCAMTTRSRMLIYNISEDLELTISDIVSGEPKNDIEVSSQISMSEDGTSVLVTDVSGNVFKAMLGSGKGSGESIKEDRLSEQVDLMPFFGQGTPHESKITSLSCPDIAKLIASVDDGGCLKIWDSDQRARTLFIDFKSRQKPLNVVMHPCGFLLAVNFGLEIKAYGIISGELEEVAAIKTNDYCSELSYSKAGHFLIGNEKSLINFYSPFTLECINRIQLGDLRLQIVSCRVSESSEYVVYQCSNNEVYLYELSNFLDPTTTAKSMKNLGRQSSSEFLNANQQQSIESEEESLENPWCKTSKFCHKNDALYSCFYFDFGPVGCKKSHAKKSSDEKTITDEGEHSNIFVGFTCRKYMVIYGNYGKKLVAQFPIENCFITCLQAENNLLFCGTSHGAVRAYRWPVLAAQLEYQIINCMQDDASTLGEGQDLSIQSTAERVRIKPLEFAEFVVWKNGYPISSICKVPNESQLVVGDQKGLIGMVSYKPLSNLKLHCLPSSKDLESTFKNANKVNGSAHSLPQSPSNLSKPHGSSERSKMMATTQKLRYMKVSELERVDKMIEKTESDIFKMEDEIKKERQHKEQQLSMQLQHEQQTFRKRNRHNEEQKNSYCDQQKAQIMKLEQQKILEVATLQQRKVGRLQSQSANIQHEQQKIEKLKVEQRQERDKYRNMIKVLAEQHKQNIKATKEKYNHQVKELREHFEKIVCHEFDGLDICKARNKSAHPSLTQYELQDFESFKGFCRGQNIEEYLLQVHAAPNAAWLSSPEFSLYSQKISDTQIRVQELQREISKKQGEHEIARGLCQTLKQEDEEMQMEFERNLKVYNRTRFKDLSLHSELLKMQNQLLERQEIIDKKNQVIKLASQEKETYEIFKELTSGSLVGREETKALAYQRFVGKQQKLKSLFAELTAEISKNEKKKLAIADCQQKVELFSGQMQQKDRLIRSSKEKLVELKRVLLLEGLGEDVEEKKVYQQQEKLLIAIKWLEKRFKLTCINEAKNISLKKEGVSQIIKQNKNLLEECNQLREESIDYESKIKHLSLKLGEASKIIELERKVSDQKSNLNQQTSKLGQIRDMFEEQLNQLAGEPTVAAGSAFSDEEEESNVHFL